MYIDAELQLSDAQALAAAAAVVGENVIDLGVAQSIGNGEPMCVMFSVLVDADQADGDEDYTFDVEYATNAAQSTGVQLMGRRIFESGTPAAPTLQPWPGTPGRSGPSPPGSRQTPDAPRAPEPETVPGSRDRS